MTAVRERWPDTRNCHFVFNAAATALPSRCPQMHWIYRSFCQFVFSLPIERQPELSVFFSHRRAGFSISDFRFQRKREYRKIKTKQNQNPSEWSRQVQFICFPSATSQSRIIIIEIEISADAAIAKIVPFSISFSLAGYRPLSHSLSHNRAAKNLWNSAFCGFSENIFIECADQMFAARFRLKIIAEAAAPKSQEFTCEFPSAYHFNYYSN